MGTSRFAKFRDIMSIHGRYNREPEGVMRSWSIGVLAVCFATVASADAQRSPVTDAGIQSRWIDGETRTAYDVASRSTVRTLTLAPSTPTGQPSGLTLVWLAFYPGRSPIGPPLGVELRAYAGPVANTNVARETDIVFALDDRGPLAMHLRYPGVGGFAGFVPPGGEIPISVARQPLDELLALAWAERVGGHAIGFAFELRRDQVDALRRFVNALMPSASSRRSPITAAP